MTRAKKHLEIISARHRMLFGQTLINGVSRFVDEIPDEHTIKNIPKRYSYSERTTQWGSTQRSQIKPQTTFASPVKKAAPAVDFALGDNVRHKAFGCGVIVKLTPMGGDHLVEINFENIGMKKLMLRVAAQMMTKE